MTPEGRYTAVLDRFEEGVDTRYAVLLLERDDDRPHECIVDETQLPSAGQHQDAILDVVIEDGELVAATYDEEATHHRRETAQRRFDQLARRPPDRDSPTAETEDGEE